MTPPDYYEPENVGKTYRPRTEAAIRAGEEARLPPAERDETRRILMVVDAQIDFVHEDGSLSVPGAVADTQRTIEWIYEHTPDLTAVAASLDSHIPNQIFYPTWWESADGNPPDAYTPISTDEVEAGHWRPLFEEAWSKQYVQRLEEEAKKQLMIWPYHTMIGTQGHNLTPALYEAVAYHASARKSKVNFVIKGTIAKTEYYSLLEPEVKVPGDPLGTLNQTLLDELLSYDQVYVAGQAKSHCVLETLTSVLRYYGDDPEIVRKFHLLIDCTSSVQHPEIDFDSMAMETFERFEEQGLNILTSDDPIS